MPIPNKHFLPFSPVSGTIASAKFVTVDLKGLIVFQFPARKPLYMSMSLVSHRYLIVS